MADSARLEAATIDRSALADELLRAMLDQVLRVGFFHADPHPGNVFVFDDGTLGLIDFGAVGRLDPIQQAAVVDMLAGLMRRDVSLLRDGIERVADVTEAVSPERLERALARLMAENIRATGAMEPTVLQDLVRMLSEFGIRLPGDLVILSRALVTLEGTLRIISPLASIVAEASRMVSSSDDAIIDREAMIRDELLAALPHLRHLPDRIDRILTLTSRGDLRIRHVVDEDGQRILRTLVNRALLLATGAVLVLAATVMLVAADSGPTVAEGTGLFDVFGYGGLLAGTVLLLRVTAGGGPRRHRPDDRRRRGPRDDLGRPRRVRPGAAGRAVLPSSRRRRAVGGLGRRSPRSSCCSSRSGRAPPEGSRPTSARVAARTPGELRQLLLAVTQIITILVPAAVLVDRSSSNAAGDGSGSSSWPRLPVGLLWLALDAAIDVPGRLPHAVRTGTWIASTRFPSLAYLAGAAAAATLGKPWLGRQWRRATDLALVALAVVMAVAGSAGAPAIALGGGARDHRRRRVARCVRGTQPPALAGGHRGGTGCSRLTRRRTAARSGPKAAGPSSTARHRPRRTRCSSRSSASDSRDADLLYRGYRALLLAVPERRAGRRRHSSWTSNTRR